MHAWATALFVIALKMEHHLPSKSCRNFDQHLIIAYDLHYVHATAACVSVGYIMQVKHYKNQFQTNYETKEG